MAYIAGLELGGTKVVCVAGEPGRILRRKTLATGSPHETLDAAAAILADWNARDTFSALGIASFGPVCINPAMSDYGRILATPKQGWSGVDVIAPFRDVLGCPIAIDTDVNGAALAERAYGAGRETDVFVYLTIGTGVGGGVVVHGGSLHGALHPEIGHMRLRRVPGDTFSGTCPFHGDCIEGLIGGPALEARFETHPSKLDRSDSRWDAPAQDLAELLAALFLNLSPQRIAIGGSVALGQPRLIGQATGKVEEILNGYLPDFNKVLMAERVVLAQLGADAGPLGALEVASRVLSGFGGL